MSLSYVVPKDQWGKNKVVGGLESAKNDEAVFARIEKEQAARGSKIQEYKFDMKQVEAFRYRIDDALRSVTRSAIKEVRIKELKTKIINSEKLKAHFEDNPLDLEYLRHDKPLHPTRVQAHETYTKIFAPSSSFSSSYRSGRVPSWFCTFQKVLYTRSWSRPYSRE